MLKRSVVLVLLLSSSAFALTKQEEKTLYVRAEAALSKMDQIVASGLKKSANKKTLNQLAKGDLATQQRELRSVAADASELLNESEESQTWAGLLPEAAREKLLPSKFVPQKLNELDAAIKAGDANEIQDMVRTAKERISQLKRARTE